jgi:hypothetical protein
VATEQGLPAFSPEPVGVRGQTTVRVDPDVERACTRKFGAWPWANLGAAADEGSIGPGRRLRRASGSSTTVNPNVQLFSGPLHCVACHDAKNVGVNQSPQSFFPLGLANPPDFFVGDRLRREAHEPPRFKERASKLPLYTFRRLDATGDPTGATLQLTAPRGLITGSSFEFARSGRGPARPDGAGGSSSKTALP